MSRLLALVLLFPISLPAQVIFFVHDADNFFATGNWAPSDPKKKPEIPSETEVNCFRDRLLCVEATAEYFMSRPHVRVNYFQVIKWDNDGIIATDLTGICMTVTMQISFADKRISSTHSVKQLEKETKEACKFFQANETQEDIFVLKGSERWRKEHSFFPQKSEK
jgi:hypothetical protein